MCHMSCYEITIRIVFPLFPLLFIDLPSSRSIITSDIFVLKVVTIKVKFIVEVVFAVHQLPS